MRPASIELRICLVKAQRAFNCMYLGQQEKAKDINIKCVLVIKYIVDNKVINMEVAITKISQNGQVVIPSDIRKDAGIKPSTKFIVFNENGNILLKQINKKSLRKDIRLIDKIMRSETQVKRGKVVKADTKLKDEEIDDLLMA